MGEITKMDLQFWGCLAIRAVRKNVSAGQLLHQTNPAQSQQLKHQLHFWGTN